MTAAGLPLEVALGDRSAASGWNTFVLLSQIEQGRPYRSATWCRSHGIPTGHFTAAAPM